VSGQLPKSGPSLFCFLSEGQTSCPRRPGIFFCSPPPYKSALNNCAELQGEPLFENNPAAYEFFQFVDILSYELVHTDRFINVDNVPQTRADNGVIRPHITPPILLSTSQVFGEKKPLRCKDPNCRHRESDGRYRAARTTKYCNACSDVLTRTFHSFCDPTTKRPCFLNHLQTHHGLTNET
jgi:hypothetical protein